VSGIFIYTNTDGYKDSRVIGSVGKHVYYYRDLKPLLGDGIAKSYAKDCLLETELYNNIGARYGITVSSIEIDEAVKTLTQKEHPFHEAYFRQCANRDLLKSKLEIKYSGVSKGKAIIVNFDQHIPFTGRNDNTNPPAGREERIATDRKYALDFVTKLHEQVAKGSMSADDAINAEESDPYLGKSAQPTSIHSGIYDSSDASSVITQLLSSDIVKAALSTAKSGTLTPVLTISSPTDATDHPKMAETKYVFIQLTNVERSADKTFESAINQQKKLGYKVVK
jgi:hypothetical protein